MNSTPTKTNFIRLSLGAIGMSLLALAFVFFGGMRASAADHTVNPGDSIQTAIDSAASGDSIIINAGTYNGSILVTKPLNIRGVGNVVINTDAGSSSIKGLSIENTTNVKIENIIIDGNNGNSPAQTGLDINSASNVVISNVVARNYGKNGVAVITQHDPSYVVGKNVTLSNVTVDNAAWAGIAFYAKSTLGNEVDLSGIKFDGTTIISNTQRGIQFGDASDVKNIYGVGADGAVELGHVVLNNNVVNFANDNKKAIVTIANTSTINGRAIVAADLDGIFARATIASRSPKVPPKTGVVL